MKARFYSCSGVGKNNEDFCICQKLDDNCTIAILVDGMGGLSYGEMASHVVAEAILSFVKEKMGKLSIRELLYRALYSANEKIKAKCYELKCKMGASVSLVFIEGYQAYFTWLGNVRIYLNRDYTKLELLTYDHIYYPETGYQHNCTYLTHCINGKEFRETPPFGEVTLAPHTQLLLCTDGLYQHLMEDYILYLGADAIELIESTPDDYSIIEIILPEP